jgi:hypothetical protein
MHKKIFRNVYKIYGTLGIPGLKFLQKEIQRKRIIEEYCVKNNKMKLKKKQSVDCK